MPSGGIPGVTEPGWFIVGSLGGIGAVEGTEAIGAGIGGGCILATVAEISKVLIALANSFWRSGLPTPTLATQLSAKLYRSRLVIL